MPSQSLAASAEQYSKFWAASERGFVSGFTSRNRDTRLKTLQKAAPYFRVARNFPLPYDVARGLDRFAPALDILDRHRDAVLTDETFSLVVNDVRRQFARAYGKADLLSAATKCLWLMHKHPVVIFDGNVRKALGAPGTDYALYLQLSGERWNKLCPEISRITTAMATRVAVPTTEEWFRRRVLDIHLWTESATM